MTSSGLELFVVKSFIRCAVCCFGLLLVADEASGLSVEESGFLLTGERPETLLAVRELIRGADATWQERGIAGASVKREFLFELKLDGEGADLEGSPQISEEAVTRTIAERWLEMRLGRDEARRQWQAQPWVLDWMVGLFLSERRPADQALWVARAGDAPLPVDQLLNSSLTSNKVLQAQRWLLGEWWTEIGGFVSMGDPVKPAMEADWAAYFFSRQREQAGPFLSLDESVRRLKTLGQVTLLVDGEEERAWLHRLPALKQTRVERDDRERELNLLREQVHPLYHRVLISLIGALKPNSDQPTFAEAFAQSWAEAEQTAEEIRSLLSR